jgi:23S rRNA pseudouridine2605 synthase
MAKRVRLHKYMANAAYCSRRHAELLIEAGLVEVNGKTVETTGHQIDPRRDTVTIHGEVIVPPEPLTIMLNKPPGFISSTHDTHDRLTVMDLLPRSVLRRGVVPAGRLDLDTRGLLLLTNDGDLLHLVTHPRYGCPKEYVVRVTGRLGPRKRERLSRGVELEDGPTQPARILACQPKGPETQVRLELTEGRKREIKRMFAVLGHEVVYLERVRIGPLKLGSLPQRRWRELSPEEIEALRGACATNPT